MKTIRKVFVHGGSHLLAIPPQWLAQERITSNDYLKWSYIWESASSGKSNTWRISNQMMKCWNNCGTDITFDDGIIGKTGKKILSTWMAQDMTVLILLTIRKFRSQIQSHPKKIIGQTYNYYGR